MGCNSVSHLYNDVASTSPTLSPASCPRFLTPPKVLAPQSREWRRVSNDKLTFQRTNNVNATTHTCTNSPYDTNNATKQHTATTMSNSSLSMHAPVNNGTSTDAPKRAGTLDDSNHVTIHKNSYLPSDVMIHCFQYLDIESLLHCKSVTRQWNSIITNEADIWQSLCLQTHMIEKHRLTLSSGRALLMVLPTLKHIQHVNLAYSQGFTNYGVMYIATFLTRLSTLNLSYCNNISDSIGNYLSTLPYLHTLNLSYCPISDNMIQHMTPCLQELEYLNLAGCQRITNKTCDLLSQHAHNLQELLIGSDTYHQHTTMQITATPTATATSSHDIASITHVGIEHLTALKLLYKFSIHSIVDNKSAYALSNMSELTHLHIEYIDNDSYTVYEYLSNMTLLKKLSMGMKTLSEMNHFLSFQRLCTHLTELRMLQLNVAVGIDDEVCVYIKKLRKIKALKISNVSNMSISGLMQLLSLPSLKELILCDNSCVTTHHLQAISCYTRIPDCMQLLQFERVHPSLCNDSNDNNNSRGIQHKLNRKQKQRQFQSQYVDESELCDN